METTSGVASWLNGNNERKTEAFTTCLEQAFLTVINMQINGKV